MSDEERVAAWRNYGLDQIVVEAWIRRTFGDKVMDNPKERALRLAEESLEVLQTSEAGCEEAHALVDMVYDKEPGVLLQEVGGVTVTLLALCAHHGLRLDDVAGTEIARMQSIARDEFQRRQEAKATLGVADRPE